MYFKYNTGFCVSYYKNSPLKSDDFAYICHTPHPYSWYPICKNPGKTLVQVLAFWHTY